MEKESNQQNQAIPSSDAPINLKKEMASDALAKQQVASTVASISAIDGLHQALLRGSFPLSMAQSALNGLQFLSVLRDQLVNVLPPEEAKKFKPRKEKSNEPA